MKLPLLVQVNENIVNRIHFSPFRQICSLSSFMVFDFINQIIDTTVSDLWAPPRCKSNSFNNKIVTCSAISHIINKSMREQFEMVIYIPSTNHKVHTARNCNSLLLLLGSHSFQILSYRILQHHSAYLRSTFPFHFPYHSTISKIKSQADYNKISDK